MRARALLALLALIAVSCGGGGSDPTTAADRNVDAEWNAETASQRAQVVEKALDDGLSRNGASCMVDATAEALGLDRLLAIDLSARTGSSTTAAEAEVLATALSQCGPSLSGMLAAAVPGALDVPASHAAEGDCFVTAYLDAIVAGYEERFRSSSGRGPHEIDMRAPLRSCEAAGALILGASHVGHREVSSLSTVEWECMVTRLPTSAFEPAFPFPDEPGDALERLGTAVDADVAYCEAWVAGAPVDG